MEDEREVDGIVNGAAVQSRPAHTEAEVSAIVAKSEQRVRHYSRDVNERRLAVDSMKKLEEAWNQIRADLFGTGSSPSH